MNGDVDEQKCFSFINESISFTQDNAESNNFTNINVIL